MQRRVADEGIDLLLLTDPDSVYYVSGYRGFPGVDWGRPTVIAVPADGGLTLVTPKLESEMAAAMTWIEDIRTYVDGEGGEWADPLRDLLSRRERSRIAVERLQVPAMVSEFLRDELGPAPLVDGSDCLGEMRMIKSPEEIETMRQASELAVAMRAAGKAVIAEGVPEYEVGLAVAAAGTRKAAELIRLLGQREAETESRGPDTTASRHGPGSGWRIQPVREVRLLDLRHNPGHGDGHGVAYRVLSGTVGGIS